MNTTGAMVRKNLLIHLALCFLGLLVGFVGNAWVGAILELAIFVAFCVMQFYDGCERGERACTTTANIEKIRAEGKDVADSIERQKFDRMVAVRAFLITAVPFVALAVINLLLADPNNPVENTLGVITRVVFFPVAGMIRIFDAIITSDFGGVYQALSAYAGNISRAGMDFPALSVAVKEISVFATPVNLQYLTYMRILFIPAGALLPLFVMLGYFRGPQLRAKKLAEIRKGSKRKKRKLKVHAPRKVRENKPEI